MSKDLVRLMHALFLPQAEACRDVGWCPAVDVYHTRDGWLVKFDLAGVRLEDVHLEVNDRRLTVRGVRRDQFIEEGGSYYRMEIAYSPFERSLELPCRPDPARLRTDYRDGMLLVHIPEDK